jgi:hypothetical protein
MDPVKIINKKIELDTFILIGEITDFNLIDQLIKEVKEQIKLSTISRKTNVLAEHTEFNSLIFSKHFHTLVKLIFPSIKKIYSKDFLIRDAWGNIYKDKNDYCMTHNHSNVGFCLILYCTDGPGPGTYFPDYSLNIPEKKGKFVLFHPLLMHGVGQYDYIKERIVVAANFKEARPWDKVDNAVIIKE